MPEQSWAFFIVKKSKDTGHLMQFWLPDGTDHAYYRRGYGSTFHEWASFSFDVPDFYKSYANLSSLASALGALEYVTTNQYDYNLLSLNNVKTYYYSTFSPVGEEGFLYVEAFIQDVEIRTNVQTFYRYDGAMIKRRMWDWSGQQWTAWESI